MVSIWSLSSIGIGATANTAAAAVRAGSLSLRSDSKSRPPIPIRRQLFGSVGLLPRRRRGTARYSARW